jgi:hypothetical protein
MGVTLPDLERAQEIAARWASAGPSIAQFAVDGYIESGAPDEVKALYRQKLSPQQRAEVMLLGMYFAAETFRNDAEFESGAAQALE